MKSLRRRLGQLALVAAVALGIPGESQAQFRRGNFGAFGFNFPIVNPAFVQQSQARFTQANPFAGLALQRSINFSNAQFLASVNPWAFYGGGVYAPTYDPYGGYVARTNLYRQDPAIAPNAYRQLFQDMGYENAKLSQAQQKQERLAKLRANASESDVLSGAALNELMAAIRDQEKNGIQGPNTPVSAEILNHVNATRAATAPPMSLLRNGGKVSWPRVLTTEPFAVARERVEKGLPELVRQASSTGVLPRAYDPIAGSIEVLKATLQGRVNEIPLKDYSTAKRFLGQLGEAVDVLQTPEAKNYLGGRWAPRGATVGELIGHMTREGLRFTAAAIGDEESYQALYRAFVGYDAAVAQLVGQR